MARTPTSLPGQRTGSGATVPVDGGPDDGGPAGAEPKRPARFELFIAGNGLRAEAIEQGVRVALSVVAPGATLKVRDIWKVPEAAAQAGVCLLPTLVRTHPSPQLRWIGEVGDVDALVAAMSP